MNAELLQQLYIDSLYGIPRAETSVSEEALYLSESLDAERLKIEIGARHRNLRSYLYKDMYFVKHYNDPKDLMPLIDSYCTRGYFLQGHGRTIIEDFCFYAYYKHSDLSHLQRIPYLLDGVMSGFISRKKPSPWPKGSAYVEPQNKERVGIDHYFPLEQLKNKVELDQISICKISAVLEIQSHNGQIQLSCIEAA